MPVYDDFEDNDLSEYTVSGYENSAWGTATTTAHDGSYGAEYANSTAPSEWKRVIAYSSTGLSAYPQQGVTFEAWILWDSGWQGICYGGTGYQHTYVAAVSAGEYWYLYLRDGESIGSRGTSLAFASLSSVLSVGDWVRLEVDWTTSDDHTGTIYDSGGTELASWSVTDTTHGNGGMGLYAEVPTSTVTKGWDSYQTTDAGGSAPSAPSNLSATLQ